MSRRRKDHQAHANHERWVISYADFITLLFAFFVVMFATANADKGKARAVSEAVKAALSESKESKVAELVKAAAEEDKATAGGKPEDVKKELAPTAKLLSQQLHPEIAKGLIELKMESRGLVISFKQAALFDSGADVVKPSAIDSIAKVAQAVLGIPNPVRLEGHTDNQPIHNSRFNNNWELSSARSIAMLQLMTSKLNIPVQRLAVSGYADVAPVASNENEDGRARNRRVDVVILSSQAAMQEAPATPPDKETSSPAARTARTKQASGVH
ncbi:MAG TPA: flagellar motor protein MotB [Bryobacteraceae bacterium]|jgi:chemotaxis protein MotB|nr:flagellar motor protein MotB [Bryobacteraceae bacterium]